MAHLSCPDQGRCYQIAGQLCPYGYDMWMAIGGHPTNLLIRCRPMHAERYVVTVNPTQVADPALTRRGPSYAPGTAESQWATPITEPQPWTQPQPTPRQDWPPKSGEPGPWPTTPPSGRAWPPETGQTNPKERKGAPGDTKAAAPRQLDEDLGY
jgi:hypothetical protein